MQLPNYYVPGDAYDELGRGDLPPIWQKIVPFFQSNSESLASPEQIRHQIQVRNLDIQRPWPLDPIPFVITDSEWAHIERGLIQRAHLLNLLVGDLYQNQKLLGPGGLPAALLFGNPKYLLPSVGYQAPNNNYLSLVAFDLGRGADGNWRVLSDWTETPQGLGMCLENRLLITQTLPGLFQAHGTQRIRDFLGAYSSQLRKPLQTDQEGETVILSPGPGDPNYFEHVYLGQYFGFHVVEGADLTVRGSSLQLKTLEGLKPVNTVWRYVPSADCDPLYLDLDSNDGVPGVINVARNSFVQFANAIGSGVLENDAFMSFFPGLCERLLEEPLILPSTATWWCGQPDMAAAARQQQGALRFYDAFNRVDSMMSGSESASVTVPSQLNYRTVASEAHAASYAPYLTEFGEIAAGPTTLRIFAANIGGEYRVLPGGIANVTSQQGDIVKDIWISAPADSSRVTHKVTSEATRRTDRDLPSRTADDLYWLGRYLERCDGAARAYRSLLTQLNEHGEDDRVQATDIVLNMLVSLGLMTINQLKHHQPINAIPTYASLLLATNQEQGFSRLTNKIYHLASQVRERLSPDAWRLFQAIYNEPFPVANQADAITYVDRLLERISALNGQIQENMTRGYGWRLLELGRGLERGHFVLLTLQAMVTSASSPMKLHLLLELCDSAITYRARYQALPQLDHVLHLLLLDEANPRSIIFQVQRLTAVMREMPLDQAGDGLSESQRILLSAFHELTLAEPAKLAEVISKAGNRTQLRRVLQRLGKTFETLSQRISETYFSHTSGAGRAR